MRFAVRFVRNWRWRLLLVILSILSSMIIHLSIFPSFHLSMKCFACTIAGGSPHLLEHEAAKWLTSMQLGSVDWLPADVTLIPKIEKMLEG